MYGSLKIACFAVACVAVTSQADAPNDNEDVDISPRGFDYHLYARSSLEKDAAAIKAELGDDVDTSLEGYEHLLFARAATDAHDEGNTQSDNDFAADLAKSLAEDDEDYDTIPDGVDEVEYQKELNENNAEDNTIPVERREIAPGIISKLIIAPSAAEKKRLGRMKPHFAKHADRVSADLKQFMRRFADDAETEDDEVDVSLEGYDHDLVRRESADIEHGGNEWEQSQEELKGYDHSKLQDDGELSPEEQAKYLKQWSEVVARGFDELEDEDDEGENDRYAAPEDVEDDTVEKRGYTPLQKLRKGVKVGNVVERGYNPLQKLRKGVKVLLGYEG